MPDYRILVTASRDWRDPLQLWQWLDRHGLAAIDRGFRVVVVHGDAAGGDQIAKLWGKVTDYASEEAHPARWNAPCQPSCTPGHRKFRKGQTSYCPAAGMYRNQEMVKAGANVCGAFVLNESKGASGCADMASRAGIVTERHFDYSL